MGNIDKDGKNGKGTTSSVRYNPLNLNNGSDHTTAITNVDGSKGVAPFIILGHELFHSLDLRLGQGNTNPTGEVDPDTKQRGMSIEESRTRVKENKLRKENNIVPRMIPYMP